MKSITLILSVYKKVRELGILLSALTRQTHKDFDVIIADDGSGEEMQRFIDEYESKSNYRITYVTQEDAGFRKNKILNKAVTCSNSDYFIFLDSDCIPHKDFIKAHFENSGKNNVLVGRRVHLNKKLSDKLSEELVITDEFDGFYLKALGKSIGFNDTVSTAEEGIVLKNKLIRRVISRKSLHIVGCNFSVSKELLLKINGFDENYTGPGIGEDSDLEYRLGLINADFKSVRNLAVVFHMYHPKTIESNSNYDYFHNKVKLKKEFYCKNGIIKV
ncbi:MAG: glycosyltransferase [Candidatus Kapaibacterium sp.]